MKIYSEYKSEGLKELLGYQCDNCGIIGEEKDLPSDFIEEQDKHYCWECSGNCKYCDKRYSIHYIKAWFNNGFCEKCQDIFKEKENEIL